MPKTIARQQSQLAYRLLAPAFLVIVLLILYPILFNLYLSFFEVQLNGEKNFVGGQNYWHLFSDERFYRSVGTTILYLLGTVIATTLVGLAVALLLNEEFAGRNLVRALVLLPYFAPVISVVFGWRFIFDPVNGIYNHLLVEVFQLTDQRHNLIGEPKSALLVVILFDIWKHFPLAFLLILAKLQSIPKDQYEAAAIDGYGAWGRFFHVTLPECRFVIGTVILLRLIWNLNRFEEVYLLAPNVETLPLYIYFQAFTGVIDQGLAAAVSVVQLLVLSGFVYIYIKKVLHW